MEGHLPNVFQVEDSPCLFFSLPHKKHESGRMADGIFCCHSFHLRKGPPDTGEGDLVSSTVADTLIFLSAGT